MTELEAILASVRQQAVSECEVAEQRGYARGYSDGYERAHPFAALIIGILCGAGGVYIFTLFL